MRREPPPFEVPPEAADATCPHCGARNIELESLFGGSVSEVMLRCQECRTIFHWLKWIEDAFVAEHSGTVSAAITKGCQS